MAMPPEQLPDSVILQQFAGLKNTVAPERLQASELERAINIDLDDVGQPRRRRGFTEVASGSYHSLYTAPSGKVFVVKSGALGVVRADYSFSGLANVGVAPLAYTSVGDDLYYSSATASGIVHGNETVDPWGAVSAEGTWLSPVVNPTDTLGAVRGKLLGPVPMATAIEAYRGRIYLAQGRTLWATELYLYNFVDKTRNFIPLEHDITLLMAVEDGLYVGTVGGLYFLHGTVFGEMKLSQISPAPVLRGSGTRVPAELVHPQARQAPVPTGEAAVFMTEAGICAGFDNGTVYNLTQGQVVLPVATSAAALFRQDSGANTYVAVTDSGGSPAANARIGDYVDAEIRRFQGG